MKTEWPISYRWARANGLRRLLPWHFLDGSDGQGADEQFMKEKADARQVRTFASRQDCDDFAGFVVEQEVVTDRVIYFHPSFSGKRNEFLISGEFESFWEFVTQVVIPDTVDWTSEEGLDDLKQRSKAAQPGATDNPDDAQRLREDH